jgi:heptosyltransferase-1
MKSPNHIVIFHPAAIGDAMLATPVASILKRNFQTAHISYWTHSSLKPIIKDMCDSVDDFVDYKRGQNIFSLSSQLKVLKADLFIDLSNSSKGKLMPFFSGTRALHYKKRPDGVKPIRHAADNFVDTIRSSVTNIPEHLFPTVFPPMALIESIKDQFFKDENEGSCIIGIVPGVGKIRPNRAWSLNGFIELINKLTTDNSVIPVLIGGPDETDLGMQIESSINGKLLNLCGKLDLAQTAAVLKQCRLVVSGDTGPAHIAVAVGTPVVGLYGPTAVERSGPYGNLDLVIDKQNNCRCQYEKQCRFTPQGTAGDCMTQITTGDVMDKIEQVRSLDSL